MPIIRNPFARRPGPSTLFADENLRPNGQNPSHPGFEKQETVGSKASSSLSIMTSKSQDNGEYKMSVVNDSGVYLPPSPTEEKSLWPRKYLGSGRNSTDTRTESGEIEHFPISRESFDSYRRSFDISARSPIPQNDVPQRQSLDSARFPRLNRSAIDRRSHRDLPPADEGFEEVGLEDHKQQTNRKRGLFSRFGDSDHKESSANSPNSSVTRFLSGRKRGQSGGQELGTIERPKSAASVETTEIH